MHTRKPSDGFWYVALPAALLLALAALTGCSGAGPTAPARVQAPPVPVCTTVHHPAVTRTILVCTGTVCRPHTVVVTPAWTEQVCQ